MLKIEEKDVSVLLNHFFSIYFVDYFEKVLSDENDECSTVVLFQGMEYFMWLCSQLDIDLPFHSIEEYVVKNYEDGKEIYKSLTRKYEKEKSEFQNDTIDFRNEYAELQFVEGE